MMPLRRVASHWLVLPNSQRLSKMVVEIRSGRVEQYYPLNGEKAQTEWLSGSILLKEDTEGRWLAYYEGKRLE